MRLARPVVVTLSLLVALLLLTFPRPASGFCGFYVSGADAKLTNNATTVVLMRDGQRTVLSMQNSYEGPPQDFAMVVPVPVVLQKENVRTLPPEIFEHVDRLSAPRLVEYWEDDPCAQGNVGGITLAAGVGHGRLGGPHSAGGDGGFGVTVLARFAVGEYDVVILGANNSVGLEGWLKTSGYKIPDGAAPLLRPYVQGGMKFFVAKVDVSKVKLKDGKARLSPLRFFYDSPTFSLPVRLGLINSNGTQDLLVNILARNQRYEVANYPNVTIPTNLDVAESARAGFAPFYASLFDRTLERHPKAVVTEYSWRAVQCDPCPVDPLGEEELATLGTDVVPLVKVPETPSIRLATTVNGRLPEEVVSRVVRQNFGRFRMCFDLGLKRNPDLSGTVTAKFVIGRDGSVVSTADGGSTVRDPAVVSCLVRGMGNLSFPQPEGGMVTVEEKITRTTFSMEAPDDFTLTRLHARYGKDSLGADLVFAAAPAIEGGREEPSARGVLPTGARPARVNDFQARYAIRHPWGGAIACAKPVRGVWVGDPPSGVTADFSPRAAQGLADAPRGATALAAFLRSDVPQLGVKAAGALVAYMPVIEDAGAPVSDAGAGDAAEAVDASVDVGAVVVEASVAAPPPTPPQSGRGCSGCAMGDTGAGEGAALVACAVLAGFAGRRRGAASAVEVVRD